MAVIEIKDVKKIYYPGSEIQVNALSGVNLTIEEGEFTAIVGPSGSGKTTLLNIVGGLDTSSSGSVNIDQTDITRLPENKLIDFRLHHIGFVFQAYNLIPVLTAKENVGFIMLLQKRPEQERNDRVTALLEEVGLSDKMDKRPNELSGGQQQRVAVARALASKPRFVLADEPTANLDSRSTGDLLDIMLRLNQEEGTTFIFSTHDQRVIDRARRVVTLEDGKIVSDVRQG
ncbi:MAG: ABC transporter ATP-binding protein [Flavobacteriales bacterium]|nr:ABC transporter ATP-binding protein [Flavobacteriales bacterium]